MRAVKAERYEFAFQRRAPVIADMQRDFLASKIGRRLAPVHAATMRCGP
jgi:hypothetical protein